MIEMTTFPTRIPWLYRYGSRPVREWREAFARNRTRFMPPPRAAYFLAARRRWREVRDD